MVLDSFLAGLPTRVAAAVTADELDTATRPPEGFAITRSFQRAHLRVDDRLVPSPFPDVRLELHAALDAIELCDAWTFARPVAVSPDVNQHTWDVLIAGNEIPDPHQKRIAATRFASGRWDVVPRLAARPPGPLPQEVSGASPAYDVRARGGMINAITVRLTPFTIRTVAPDHPDVRVLLDAMMVQRPAWEDGWTVDPPATFVIVGNAAGAGLIDAGDRLAKASQLCILRETSGVALLDGLEAVARNRGFTRLRLDSSAFVYGLRFPPSGYGYEVGPPYDGNADVEVWTEKVLS